MIEFAKTLKSLLFVWAVVFGFADAVVASPKSNTNPGTDQDWNDIDEVTIVRPFRFSTYRQVAIAPLDTRDVRLPPPEENTYPLAKEVLSASAQLFVQGLKDKLSGTSVQVTQGSADRAALIVRARLEKLDPGSVSARMWAPGAGAAQTLISGEIVDAGTKEVLVRFRQERRSVMKLIWQHESIVLSRTIKQIGGDVAGLLKAF